MIDWQWFGTSQPPRDGTVILLKGGSYDSQGFDKELHPEHYDMRSAPAVAKWVPDVAMWGDDAVTEMTDRGYWHVTTYDGGVCPIEYHNPTHWGWL